MLTVEALCIGDLHSEHLQVGNLELLFGKRDDLADVEIGIGLDHSVSPICLTMLVLALFGFDFIASKVLSVLNNLELPTKASEHRPHVEIVERDFGILDAFKERLASFEVELHWITAPYHFDFVHGQVVDEVELLDDGGLRIEPLHDEDIALVGGHGG